MADEKKVPNLKAKYTAEVAPALMQKFGYKSTMQIPRLEKIVVNVGCSEARENAKVLDAVVSTLAFSRASLQPTLTTIFSRRGICMVDL